IYKNLNLHNNESQNALFTTVPAYDLLPTFILFTYHSAQITNKYLPVKLLAHGKLLYAVRHWRFLFSINFTIIRNVSQSGVGAGRAKRLFGKIWLKRWHCAFCQCALQQRDGEDFRCI
ncbi:hypothetical protein ACFLTE_09840, partial [Bacteroidota bacterium]